MGRPLDVFDVLLTRTLAWPGCLSHLPLFSGYDEPETLSYKITLYGPIGTEPEQATPFRVPKIRGPLWCSPLVFYHPEHIHIVALFAGIFADHQSAII